MKKAIRLTEGDLHKIIKESVKKIIKESREQEYADMIRKNKSIENRLKIVLSRNRFGSDFNIRVRTFPHSGGMDILIKPVDDTFDYNTINVDDIVSRVIAKDGYVIDDYTNDERGINLWCEKTDDALDYMPRPGVKQPNNPRQSYNYTNDGDNINLNSPNDAEAVRRSYAGKNYGYSSSSDMESPNSPNSAAGIRRWYYGW